MTKPVVKDQVKPSSKSKKGKVKIEEIKKEVKVESSCSSEAEEPVVE